MGQRLMLEGWMQGFDLSQAVGLEQIEGAHFTEVLLRLCAALLLSGLLAYRPWRRWLRRAPDTRIETAHSQILIAVAGALIILVIGDNMARAFGLVGLGGFIRFRSGIKDPSDAAVMFVMIGVGMACGLGVVPVALVCTLFVAVVLAFFDMASAGRPHRLRVGVVVDDARTVLPLLRAAFPSCRVVTAGNTSAEKGKIVMEMDAAPGMDASTILLDLQSRGVPSLREVWVEDE